MASADWSAASAGIARAGDHTPVVTGDEAGIEQLFPRLVDRVDLPGRQRHLLDLDGLAQHFPPELLEHLTLTPGEQLRVARRLAGRFLPLRRIEQGCLGRRAGGCGGRVLGIQGGEEAEGDRVVVAVVLGLFGQAAGAVVGGFGAEGLAAALDVSILAGPLLSSLCVPFIIILLSKVQKVCHCEPK